MVGGGRPYYLKFWVNRPLLTTLSLTFFNEETLEQAFFKRSAIIDGKRQFCCFANHLRGLGATYDDHLTLIGKRLVDFLLVLIELFSPGVTVQALRTKIDRKSAISL